ncbi:MAG: hypothetical protein ACOZAO_03200 [Patescibacteria group bacterium]
MTPRFNVGVSVASFLPFSAIPAVGVALAAAMRNAVGYKFTQILPLRSFTSNSIQAVDLNPVYAEHAWNPNTFSRFLIGLKGYSGEPSKLHDVLFFPSPGRAEDRIYSMVALQSLRLIHHTWKDLRSGFKDLVELNAALPERSLTALVQHAMTFSHKVVVIDTRHMAYNKYSDKWHPFGLSVDVLNALLPYTGAIQVQARPDEGWDFTSGSWLSMVLNHIGAYYQIHGGFIDLIVEANPAEFGKRALVDPFYLVEQHKQLRQNILKRLFLDT